jgi:hypothetical protein
MYLIVNTIPQKIKRWFSNAKTKDKTRKVEPFRVSCKLPWVSSARAIAVAGVAT